MQRTKSTLSIAIATVFAVAVTLAGGSTTRAGSPQGDEMKRITIEANARGTSAQLGRTVGVTIIINEFSTPEDQQALLQAFQAKGSQGLANALGKMHAKGRIAITGTIGYDLNYIRQFQTPTGTRIRFVTDRPVRMGENWADSRSTQYNLSAGEIDIPTGGDSTGTLMPSCQLSLDKEKQLQIKAFQNPWTLINIRVNN